MHTVQRSRSPVGFGYKIISISFAVAVGLAIASTATAAAPDIDPAASFGQHQLTSNDKATGPTLGACHLGQYEVGTSKGQQNGVVTNQLNSSGDANTNNADIDFIDVTKLDNSKVQQHDMARNRFIDNEVDGTGGGDAIISGGTATHGTMTDGQIGGHAPLGNVSAVTGTGNATNSGTAQPQVIAAFGCSATHTDEVRFNQIC